MRLWSLHPEYLDSRGLVALWREGFLALEVLKGKTKGYRSHPQLSRFRGEENPVETPECNLWFVFLEAERRESHFSPAKIETRTRCRDPFRYEMIEGVDLPRTHSLFESVSAAR